VRLGAAPVVRLERPLAHVRTPESSCQKEAATKAAGPHSPSRARLTGRGGHRPPSLAHEESRARDSGRCQALTRYGDARARVKPGGALSRYRHRGASHAVDDVHVASPEPGSDQPAVHRPTATTGTRTAEEESTLALADARPEPCDHPQRTRRRNGVPTAAGHAVEHPVEHPARHAARRPSCGDRRLPAARTCVATGRSDEPPRRSRTGYGPLLHLLGPCDTPDNAEVETCDAEAPRWAGIAVRGTDPGEVTTLGEGAHVGRTQLVDNRVDHHQEREVSGGGDA
jgi:hypothetical protein